MRTLALLLFTAVGVATATAQEASVADGTTIEVAEVSGLSMKDLSPGLRQAIESLTGRPLVRAELAELASRIESERPGVVAAARAVPRDEGRARVVFLVARVDDAEQLTANVNARYVVDRVDLRGIPDERVSTELRSRLQGLVDRRLDPTESDELVAALKAELAGYDVTQRLVRGAMPGRVRVVFDIRRSEASRLLHFEPVGTKFIYHSDQAWSGVLDLPVGTRTSHRVTFGVIWGNNDDLVEEYSGFRVRVESRELVSERLGASFEFTRVEQTWREQTLLKLGSLPQVPETYRTRVTVQPMMTVALGPRVRVAFGVSVSDLELQTTQERSAAARALVARGGMDRRWTGVGATHAFDATYELKSATDALGSDLRYTRHVAKANYRVDRGHHAIISRSLFGTTSDESPLFERFTLGDSLTLRGWNKFDFAPAGGTRVVHHTLEYRYRALAYFLDAGDVWDQGADRRARFSTGVGLHGAHGFLTVGFPLNDERVGATVIAGVRF